MTTSEYRAQPAAKMRTSTIRGVRAFMGTYGIVTRARSGGVTRGSRSGLFQRFDQDPELADLVGKRLAGDLEHGGGLILVPVGLSQRFFDELPPEAGHGVLIRPER